MYMYTIQQPSWANKGSIQFYSSFFELLCVIQPWNSKLLTLNAYKHAITNMYSLYAKNTYYFEEVQTFGR